MPRHPLREGAHPVSRPCPYRPGGLQASDRLQILSVFAPSRHRSGCRCCSFVPVAWGFSTCSSRMPKRKCMSQPQHHAASETDSLVFVWSISVTRTSLPRSWSGRALHREDPQQHLHDDATVGLVIAGHATLGMSQSHKHQKTGFWMSCCSWPMTILHQVDPYQHDKKTSLREARSKREVKLA